MSLTGQHVIHLPLLPIALRPFQFGLGFQHVIHSKPKIILAILSYWQHCFSFILWCCSITHVWQLFHTAILCLDILNHCLLERIEVALLCVLCGTRHKAIGFVLDSFGLMHTYYSKMKCSLVNGQISLHYILKHERVVYSAKLTNVIYWQ
jgi:hypothetical protein